MGLPDHNDDEEESRASFPSPTRLPANHQELLKQFDRMLQKALQTTSGQITEHLTREICELGCRNDLLETRKEEAEGSMDKHALTLGKLTDDSMMLHDKLENLENRSCRAHLCFRRVPDHIKDLQAIVTILLKDLTLIIPEERLELERVHRALTRFLRNGPPRDIIFYVSILSHIEAVMAVAQAKQPVML